MSAAGSIVADDALRADVERFAAAQTGRAARVRDLHMIAGGASQEAWSLDLELGAPGEAEVAELVMRRDIGGSLTFIALDRAHEFAVIAAAHAAGVPAPRPYFAPAEIGGKRAFFMERLRGEAVGRRIVSESRLAAARERLPEQLAAALAAIHAVDPARSGIDTFLYRPTPGASAVESEIVRLYRELDSVAEPHPAVEAILRRLLRSQPEGERELAFVHGDFRIGNVLVDERGLTGVLDWEFAHVGDPHEDLAWFCVRAWRFGNDALRAGGICDRETFVRAYERASGRAIDRARLDYFETLGNAKWAVGALMQSRRHLDGLERSVELASLGRIAAEIEFEGLRQIAPDAVAGAVRRLGAAAGPDVREAGAYDRPTAAEIVDAVREYLADEVIPTLADRRGRFRALIAANVLAIAGRELRGTGFPARESERLDAFGIGLGSLRTRRATLCAEIRSGRHDGDEAFSEIARYAAENVVEQLAVANPRLLRGAAPA